MKKEILYIVCALLVIGALPLPFYGFYTFVRIVAFLTFGYCALTVNKDTWVFWAFIGLAILFNPFIPIHMSKEAWAVIDISSAIALFLSKDTVSI